MNGGNEDVVLFCGSGATGAIDKLIRLLALDRRRSAGGVHRTLRAPLERAAVAGVARRRRSRSAKTATAASMSSISTYELRRHADRASEDRQLLGRVERDGRDHRRRRGRDHAASARRAVLLGLRGRRPVSADRHERRAGPSQTGSSRTRTRCSSRRTSSSAAPGRPACSSSSARCCATAFRRYRAAEPSCS